MAKTERGRATRVRIVAAATTLFQEQGYLDTTMAAIAEAASVSVQTLYLAFGSKVAILRAVHDVAVEGDEPLPVLERAWVGEMRAEPIGARALEIVVNESLAIVERVHPVYVVIERAAADAEVGELLANIKRQRYETMGAFAHDLAAKRGFAGESAAWAGDVLYAVICNELYRLLVIERGWTSDAWRRWVYDSIVIRLFPAALSAARRRVGTRTRAS